MTVKKTAKKQFNDGKPGPGRPKGVPNKTTSILKDALMKAAMTAGAGEDGKLNEEALINYLTMQAQKNPNAFMSLLGKLIPATIAGDPDNPLTYINKIEIVTVDSPQIIEHEPDAADRITH